MPAGDRVRIESLHVSWPGSFFLVVVGIFGTVVVLGKILILLQTDLYGSENT